MFQEKQECSTSTAQLNLNNAQKQDLSEKGESIPSNV